MVVDTEEVHSYVKNERTYHIHTPMRYFNNMHTQYMTCIQNEKLLSINVLMLFRHTYNTITCTECMENSNFMLSLWMILYNTIIKVHCEVIMHA